MNSPDLYSQAFDAAAKEVVAPLGKFLKKKYDHVLVDFDSCFTSYLTRSHQYYSVTKTLISKHEPVSLSSIYVATDFEVSSEIIKGEELLDKVIQLKNSIVFGIAGAGKSMLAKMLFLNTVLNRTGFTPILVELRNLKLTETGNQSIEQYIFDQIHALNSAFTVDQLIYALTQGKFLLIFDGYDEVPAANRERISKNIQSISYAYANSVLVVTSRYDEQIESWSQFHTIIAQPLSQQQAVQIIDKIAFSGDVKQKFIDRLENGLFKERREFLSNPLLLTIMLLTFDELADIPSKMHIYYEHAFHTLYFKHDANKGVYQRQHYTSLAIDEFKKVFSAFCLQSYVKVKYRFDYSEITQLLQSSLDLENIEASNSSPNNLLKDLTESVCLLQQDGFEYSFVHRSFQEYFTASYISKSNSLNVEQMLDHLLTRFDYETILDLLFDMDEELVEKRWVLPRVKLLTEKLNEYIKSGNYLEFVSAFVIGFTDMSTDTSRRTGGIIVGSQYMFCNLLLRYEISVENERKSPLIGFRTLLSGEFLETHGVKDKRPKEQRQTAAMICEGKTYTIESLSKLELDQKSYSNMYPESFLISVVNWLDEIRETLTMKYEKKTNTLDALFSESDH